MQSEYIIIILLNVYMYKIYIAERLNRQYYRLRRELMNSGPATGLSYISYTT